MQGFDGSQGSAYGEVKWTLTADQAGGLEALAPSDRFYLYAFCKQMQAIFAFTAQPFTIQTPAASR